MWFSSQAMERTSWARKRGRDVARVIGPWPHPLSRVKRPLYLSLIYELTLSSLERSIRSSITAIRMIIRKFQKILTVMTWSLLVWNDCIPRRYQTPMLSLPMMSQVTTMKTKELLRRGLILPSYWIRSPSTFLLMILSKLLGRLITIWCVRCSTNRTVQELNWSN